MASSDSSRFWRPKKGSRGGNLARTHPGSCARVHSSSESPKAVAESRRDDRALSIPCCCSLDSDIALKADSPATMGVAL